MEFVVRQRIVRCFPGQPMALPHDFFTSNLLSTHEAIVKQMMFMGPPGARENIVRVSVVRQDPLSL